jgi:RNA polymerase sigma-70 factor (ECF subfamily)
MQQYNALPDDELLQLLNEGDRAAFTQIYNRYWEKLLAIGFYHTKQKSEAEDIVHDVMMSLWLRRQELRIQSLDAYLATAVKFAVFKTLARNKRQRALADDLPVQGHTSPIEEKLEAKFLEEYIRGSIEQLPDKARLVFQYRRSEELPVQLVAGKLDLSPKAVEYHMTKALRILREKLKKIKFHFFLG